MTQHPSGLLFVHQMGCPLLAAEDATAAADHERYRASARTRAVTPAERTLLAACGVVLDQAAQTSVHYLTGGVRRRSWAGVDLDAPTPAPAPTEMGTA